MVFATCIQWSRHGSESGGWGEAQAGAQDRRTELAGSVQQSHHIKTASQEPDARAGTVTTA
jgi:hypothetical protein